MAETAISFGIIVLFVVGFYFIIKNAVKNGINQSELFSDKLREAQRKREAEKKRVTGKGFDKEV